jgi:hypothetical protein
MAGHTCVVKRIVAGFSFLDAKQVRIDLAGCIFAVTTAGKPDSATVEVSEPVDKIGLMVVKSRLWPLATTRPTLYMLAACPMLPSSIFVRTLPTP